MSTKRSHEGGLGLFWTHSMIVFSIPIFRFLSNFGFDRLLPKFSILRKFVAIQSIEDVRHEALHPFATYAPWRLDREFNRVYEVCSENTLVDLYRCFDLWSLVDESSKSGEGDILEVGVWKGGTGGILAAKAKMLNPNTKVFLADTFSGVVKAGDLDTSYTGGEHSNTSTKDVSNVIRKLDLNNVEILQGIFPDDKAHLISNRKFQFCHIDVDTYDSALGVFNWITPRLNTGGIVVFDDYGFYNCTGVTRLVNELRKDVGWTFIYNLNGHGVFIKR